MFGEEVGYMSSQTDELSEDMKAKIDNLVKKILQESEARVEKLLLDKEWQIRELSKNLYWYDYLDEKEMGAIFKGENIEKDKVRNWDAMEQGGKTHGLITFNNDDKAL